LAALFIEFESIFAFVAEGSPDVLIEDTVIAEIWAGLTLRGHHCRSHALSSFRAVVYLTERYIICI